MPEENREAINLIAQQVRDYLNAHPKASDTLEGSVGWWLPEEGASASAELVQAALDGLVAGHELVRFRSADGHVLYARREQ
jgi:hypothetical protein